MRGRAFFVAMALGMAGAVPAWGADIDTATPPYIETMGGHCNDAVFDSDGGGLSGCIELAMLYNYHVFGIGIYGVEPEQKNGVRTDPLEEKGRLIAWYGQNRDWGMFDFNLAARAGIEGGVADDIAIELRDFFHDLFGIGKKDLDSQNDTEFVAGVSGFIRTHYNFNEGGSFGLNLQPYAHAALGIDVVEGGAGVMLALQPGDAAPMGLLLPKNGAYAPTFGGDGLAIFGGVRGVAHDGLYEELVEEFIAEAGVKGQLTLFNRLVLGAAASCTNKPYEGAPGEDCKAYFQLGGIW